MIISTGDIIYQLVVFGLFGLFIISLILFIRRLLINSTGSHRKLYEIENKLDRIIELMEKDKS